MGTGRGGIGSNIYQPIGGVGVGCNISVYSDGINTHNEPFDGLSPNLGIISNIGYRYTSYFSGTPTDEPTTGTPSNPEDRYIANDYEGAYIQLDVSKSPTVMHLEAWVVEFWVNKPVLDDFDRLVSESDGTDSNRIEIGCGAGVEQSGLRFFVKQGGSTVVSVNSTLVVYESKWNHVRVERTLAGDIILTKNRTETEVLYTGLVGSFTPGTFSFLGAAYNSSIINDFTALWLKPNRKTFQL